MTDAPTAVRGVIFDSGDVLARPVAGSDAPSAEAWRRWFPGGRFYEIVRARLPSLSLDGMDDAIDRGMEYLDERHRQPMMSTAEERDLFTRFYAIVLESLGSEGHSPSLPRELALARVDGEQMEPFPEVPDVLERLRARGLRLGVLSEAWPSLAVNYERLGLRHLFEAFVISAQEARLKDDPILFAIARERLGLAAEEILFVDDWPPYVQVAIGAGMQGAVLAREPDVPVVQGLSYVRDLNEVENLAVFG